MEKETNILREAIVDPAIFCVTWEQIAGRGAVEKQQAESKGRKLDKKREKELRKAERKARKLEKKKEKELRKAEKEAEREAEKAEKKKDKEEK